MPTNTNPNPNAWEVVCVRPAPGRDGPLRATVRSGARVQHVPRLTADDVADLDEFVERVAYRWSTGVLPPRPSAAPVAEIATVIAERVAARRSA